MQRITSDLVVGKLRGAQVLGAITMPNSEGLGIVFDNGLVLDLRTTQLLGPDESSIVLETARRRLARERAEIITLDAGIPRQTFLDAIREPVSATEAERDAARDQRRKVTIEAQD